MASLGNTFDEPGLDRQFRCGERQRFFGDGDRNAIDLEQDTTGLYTNDPKLGRPLAFAHAHFDRLLRYRYIREHADPYPAGPLHEARERAARSLDLACGNAFGLECLETILTEGKRVATGGDTVDAAFERFAKLGADRLQHDLNSVRPSGCGFTARTTGVALG